MPRTYGKAKQTRLSFTPVASSSPGIEHSPGTDRLAKVRYEHPSKASISRGRLQTDDYSSFTRKAARSSPSPADSSSSVDKARGPSTSYLPTLRKSSKMRTNGDEKQVKDEPSQDERKLSEIPSPCPLPPKNLKVEELSSEEDDIQTSAQRQRRPKEVVAAEDSESSSDDASAAPVQKMKAPRNKASSSRELRSHRAPEPVDNREFSVEIRTPPKTRSAARRSRNASDLPTLAGPASRVRYSAHHLSDLGSPETSDADEIVTPATSRRLKRGAAPSTAFVVDDSDDSDDIVVSSPAKRRRRDIGPEAPRTPALTSEQDRIDLEEDLQDLQDSAVKKTRTRGRLANSTRSKRQEQLELLRRRRAGERAKSISEPEAAHEDSESAESQTVQELDEEEPLAEDSEDSDVEAPVSENEDLDRYEDDFVLQDDDGEIGAPSDLADMPFEFTRHSYKQPKEFFRDVVEWMVHNKLNPAFPRNDPVYEVAFMKLEDEVKGRAGSQLVSTVWNSDFRRALMARPQIEVTLFPITEGHPCDACNRSGHPASFDIKLYGKAYSLETLEPVSDDDSDEQSEESEDPRDRDREGNPLPDEDTRFYLGRHCKSKATMAHTLIHWRFHLNEWIVDYLDRQGIFTDDRVIERSHWSQKRKTKHANEVVDMMVESGEVKKLWRDFHINLKAARDTTETRW